MKKRIVNIAILALLAAGTCGWAVAQAVKEETPDRAVVPLSNPAKPAKIEVTVMRGSITVKGYQGKEIIVEARVREKALSNWGGFSTGYAMAPPAIATAPGQPTPAPAPAPAAKPGPIDQRVQKQVEAALAASNLAASMADQEALARRIAREYEKAPAPTASSSRTTRKPVTRKRRRSPA